MLFKMIFDASNNIVQWLGSRKAFAYLALPLRHPKPRGRPLLARPYMIFPPRNFSIRNACGKIGNVHWNVCARRARRCGISATPPCGHGAWTFRPLLSRLKLVYPA